MYTTSANFKNDLFSGENDVKFVRKKKILMDFMQEIAKDTNKYCFAMEMGALQTYSFTGLIWEIVQQDQFLEWLASQYKNYGSLTRRMLNLLNVLAELEVLCFLIYAVNFAELEDAIDDSTTDLINFLNQKKNPKKNNEEKTKTTFWYEYLAAFSPCLFFFAYGQYQGGETFQKKLILFDGL
ncbi:hypothetical protein RFI_21860 [Reticulomyxa filosa]|uniref:Uncharacterized protein n=1 Tax=Reticulomyxa filosa TaxID=46433 RepID=X6MQY2_RETFI|nr:hypothetical protein RFI_21860 [Reticulomyxa filosa]|eukprot:ETO15505.1 hypothetical protein RFI_21860 [Reticulomyxa filosa]